MNIVTSLKSLRDFWADVANRHEDRQAVDRLHEALRAPVSVVVEPARPITIFETERIHSCRFTLAAWVENDLDGMPAPGSIAQCTCARYFYVTDRGDRWLPVRWWNFRALAIIADSAIDCLDGSQA